MIDTEKARAQAEELRLLYAHPLIRKIGHAAADTIDALLNEVEHWKSEAASWEKQASDRVDDALKFAAERDALIAEVERLNSPVALSEWQKLVAERDALAREVDACAAALPGPYYMDPPDGGDVSISEQLRRMARDAARYRHLRVQRWFHDEVISASDKGPRDPDNVDTEIDRDMQFEAMKGARDES